MNPVTPDEIKGVVKTVRNDWKAVVTLLLAALIFFGGCTWMITGYVVKAADASIKANSFDIAALKSDLSSIRSTESINDSRTDALIKRQDETLAELKLTSAKLSGVAESQARIEGIVMGLKK